MALAYMLFAFVYWNEREQGYQLTPVKDESELFVDACGDKEFMQSLGVEWP